MAEPKVIELKTKQQKLKQKEYEKFLVYELPTLEVSASIEYSFYSPEGKSITDLQAIVHKALDDLAYVHSKLPPDKAERFIRKCLPWWKCMKSLQAEIRKMAIEDLQEQGIVLPEKKGTA